jgi:hypothetical protein
MSKIRAKAAAAFGAVALALSLGFLAIPAASAHADPCGDATTLRAYYDGIGDHATANLIAWNLLINDQCN